MLVVETIARIRRERYRPDSSLKGVKIGRRSGVRPRRWTVSGGGFDLLPGVVILELCWA